MNIIKGIIIDIALLTKRFVFVKFMLALSNFSSSYFSVLKALITSIPVKLSLVTRFNLSTSFCTILNLGIANTNNTTTKDKIDTTATTITHPIPAPLLTTFTIPPIPNIGA